MKRSKYINKYDYINYYTKQSAFWFFANNEINAAINTELKKLNLLNEQDDEDEDESDCEFDSYEYYKEQKELLKDIDKNDPKIFEGIMIDNKSREFIIEQYKNVKQVIDFEDQKYKHYNQEEISKLTKELLLNNENIILFQPIFIYKDLITKPDAIIKLDQEIILVETKSTTTSKRHHFLDIYFQYQVLSNLDYLQDFYFNLNLCLVAYCYANRYEVKFIITDSFNINTSYTKKTNNLAWKQLIKMGKGFISVDEFVEAPITFNATCNEDLSELIYRKEIAKNKKSIEEAETMLSNIYNEFDKVINILIKHKQELLAKNIDCIEQIEVSANEKSWWKKSELFPKLREIYHRQGHDLFKYSGYITKQTYNDIIEYQKSNHDITKFFKKPEYENYFIYNKKIIKNKTSLDNFLNLLKNKKVYFDFETINSPIRPIDHCLPFMQILTQCSVIIDDQTQPISKVKCNNILIDPINITIEHFKQIIDALEHGNDYSYVVYNKSFECTRLNEMAKFINDPIYDLKVQIINSNIYDLADFFKVNSSKFTCPLIIPELFGFYSIKKVLPIVMKQRRDIFDDTGCVDYHDLDVVQNGLICQSETTKRFHNMLTNEEWDKLSINLKKYCENDVRAMVAVEYYVRALNDEV